MAPITGAFFLRCGHESLSILFRGIAGIFRQDREYAYLSLRERYRFRTSLILWHIVVTSH